jgi:hypothetical protein
MQKAAVRSRLPIIVGTEADATVNGRSASRSRVGVPADRKRRGVPVGRFGAVNLRNPPLKAVGVHERIAIKPNAAAACEEIIRCLTRI